MPARISITLLLLGITAGCRLQHSRPQQPTSSTDSAAANAAGTPLSCIPVTQRAEQEFGCYIVASHDLGELPSSQVVWHLTRFPNRATAEAAKTSRGTVVESLGSTWLFTIAEPGWRPAGGEHLAQIGPLPVTANRSYTAQYMEAVFRPGMKSAVHRHSGPEAWYTLRGETCLETPDGTYVGRAGGHHVIVPGGPPMELTATGTEVRRALVLILHDSALPPTTRVSDWQPKGLCKV